MNETGRLIGVRGHRRRSASLSGSRAADLTAAEIAFELGLPEYSVAAKLYRLRRDDLLPKVGRGRRKRITTEDEDIAALMARFSAACAVIKEACGQDDSASGKEGK